MSVSIQSLTAFEKIFTGNKQAYGIHLYTDTQVGKKEEGKSFTKVEPVQTALYTNHLNGKKGLGIIPISTGNKCSFSVIDVDVYDGSISFLIDTIYKYEFPLVPFKSKSGGLHLYLFYDTPIPAKKSIAYCKLFITLLGLPIDTEVFPKQSKLQTGQAGNWINLPYYKHSEPKQYMISSDKEPKSLEEALLSIEEHLFSESKLNEFLENMPLNDAPPCLQSIYLKGDTSNRNEYLFSMARYLKTKHGDDFEYKITEVNNELSKPISISELTNTIISTYKKKDWAYKCTQEPICSLCNKAVCKTREYGIGGSEISELSFEEFTQIQTDPPYYEWIINEQTLTFFTEMDIIAQAKFRELCFRQLHVLPLRLKDNTWTTIVNSALKNIQIKEVDNAEDMSPGGMLLTHLYEFLEQRTLAENKEQIMIDRVFKDKNLKAYVFKSKNLIAFLLYQKQFREFRTVEVQDRLRKLGGKSERYYISTRYKTARVWTLPFKSLEPLGISVEHGTVDIDFMEDLKDEDF